ncbi:carbohydrate kinase family protein [Candidatus Saccharibacteria bacterium]|nr:carbohydrate kinase family protein [Candidatus Saccharibacteria bacterium]
MTTQVDVLSVGDVVSDAFIKLLDDKAHTYVDHNGVKTLAMEYGTKVPFEKAVIVEGVGNAANAAVSLTRLGLNCGFVTNVGEDKYGRGIIAALHANKIDTRWVTVNPGKVSNYHYVLWYKEERTILIKHEEYDYSWPNLRKKEAPKWIYFSSIAKNSLEFHDDLADWLEENPETKLAFQPGTYQMKFGAKRLKKIYKNSKILVLNRQEAELVGGGNVHDVHDLFNKLHELGPEIICITDGPNGAYASSPQGRLFMPIYPDLGPPVERTGAGDAFASTFTAALMRGKSIEEALKWAPINSMNVVQHVGAQEGLLTEEELEGYLRKAPDWYHSNPLR